MRKEDVETARQKHRVIMYYVKNVSRRVKGMGLKIFKFHGIVHLADNILNFGVPMEVDTGANESGHKATKKAAKLTQRKAETFDEQTMKRLEEVHLLQLAEEELAGNCLWDYYNGRPTPDAQMPDALASAVGGARVKALFCPQEKRNYAFLITKNKSKHGVRLELQLIDFIAKLQTIVGNYTKSPDIWTKYVRDGQIFRAHTHFFGQVWRDWAVIDWGDEGHLPCEMMGFIDLRDMPGPINCEIGGVSALDPEIYCIVQCSECVHPVSQARNKEERRQMELDVFRPLTKIVGGFTEGKVSHLKFFLAPVDAIVRDVLITPDLGGAPNGYLEVLPRSRWRKALLEWFNDEQEDHLSDCSSDDTDCDVQNYTSDTDSDVASLESSVDSTDNSDDEL